MPIAKYIWIQSEFNIYPYYLHLNKIKLSIKLCITLLSSEEVYGYYLATDPTHISIRRSGMSIIGNLLFSTYWWPLVAI